jgi:hypothetical protein
MVGSISSQCDLSVMVVPRNRLPAIQSREWYRRSFWNPLDSRFKGFPLSSQSSALVQSVFQASYSVVGLGRLSTYSRSGMSKSPASLDLRSRVL